MPKNNHNLVGIFYSPYAEPEIRVRRIGEKLNTYVAHNVHSVRQTIAAAGASILYPELGTSELAFAQLKPLLRKAAGRTKNQLWSTSARFLDA